jgi:hypothetical protein
LSRALVAAGRQSQPVTDDSPPADANHSGRRLRGTVENGATSPRQATMMEEDLLTG